jgi:hypothetical protein
MPEDLKQFAEEIKRHFDVTAESLRSEIRLVAEGLITLDERMERKFAEVSREFEEVSREFDEVKAMIKFSHAELARRLDSHEHDIADLRERIERLERKPS